MYNLRAISCGYCYILLDSCSTKRALTELPLETGLLSAFTKVLLYFEKYLILKFKNIIKKQNIITEHFVNKHI